MKTLVELKWSNRSANMIKLDDIYQILELETNESLIVLPANNKIEEAIDLVLNKYDIYILNFFIGTIVVNWMDLLIIETICLY